MILICTRYSKWATGQKFNKGDEVEVGKVAIGNIITDKMAADMLKCDYAVKKDAKPRIETKKEAVEEEIESAKVSSETTTKQNKKTLKKDKRR